MVLGSTQPLTEISTRNLPGGNKRPTLPPSVSRMSENVGASTSHNSNGLHGLYRDKLTFTFTSKIPGITSNQKMSNSFHIFSVSLLTNNPTIRRYKV
jgi:hypothetical protein